MYGGQPQYNLLEAHATMSLLLMIPLERYGFIFLKINLICVATFKKWKAEVENQTGLSVKSLRTYNDREYDSQEFKEFCAGKGIRMIRTVPGRPEQNGIAERMNRTLNERARSMRLHAGLPKTFWADAINTAAYLINRGPSVPLCFKIPEEEWTGKKVDLSYLKVFGCASYAHVDPDARDKLDAKATKCYLIGYGSDYIGYRLWYDQNRKIIKHKDITFDESKLYKDKLAVEFDSTWKTVRGVRRLC